MLGMDVLTQAAASLLAHLLYDAHGTTKAILNAATSSVVERYVYSAYGIDLSLASAPLSSLRYAGEFMDPITGLSFNRARWYDSSNGRWNRLDPWSANRSQPLSLHKYSYTGANPVTGVDPSGLFTLVDLLSTIAIQAILLRILAPVYKPAMSLFADSMIRNLLPLPVFLAFHSGNFPASDGFVIGGGVGGSFARGPLGASFVFGLDFVFSANLLAGLLSPVVGGPFNAAAPSIYYWGEYSIGFGQAQSGITGFIKAGLLFNTSDSSAYAGGYRAITVPYKRLPARFRQAVLAKLAPTRWEVFQKLAAAPVAAKGIDFGRLGSIVTRAANALATLDSDTQISISWGTAGSSFGLSLILGGRTAGSAGTIGYSIGYADLITAPDIPFA